MPPRHTALACLATLLLSSHAAASNDGQLCKNPLGLVVCGGLMAADALTPQSWAQRMEKAVIAGQLDDLKRLADNHPQSLDAINLLTLAAAHFPSDDKSIDQRLAMLGYLLDKTTSRDDPRMAAMIETIAASSSPRRIEALNLWFTRGVSAKGVSLAERSIGWGVEGPQVLRLLVAHGANPNFTHAGAEPPLMQALRTRNFGSAELLIELGADPDAPMGPGEPSSLMRLATTCGSRAPCTPETLRMIEFLLAHGAEPNGRARPDGDCITPLDIARISREAALEALLLRYKADPDFRCAR